MFPVKRNFAENIKDLSAQCGAFFFNFFQELEENLTFASVIGDQVPQMANLFLPDSMNSPKSLFKPIRIPEQVIVNHEVGILQIDTSPTASLFFQIKLLKGASVYLFW